MKAIPYIETIGTEKFKKFLRQPFKKGQEFYFKNIDAHNIQYFPGNSYSYNNLPVGPIPTNLDEFIIDMKRIGIILEWKDDVIEKFEPQDYLAENEIEKYYLDLLNKMDKGHELNNKRNGMES
jgi:hypothetical protein